MADILRCYQVLERIENDQRLEAHTNAEDEAGIDAGDLGGMATSERVVVSAPAIGLTTEMVVDPAGSGERHRQTA